MMTTALRGAIVVVLLLRFCEPFLHSPTGRRVSGAHGLSGSLSRTLCLPAIGRDGTDEEGAAEGKDNEDQGGDEEEVRVDGDWRAFRARLVAQGLDGGAEGQPRERKALPEANQNLLRAQNPKLFDEYMAGAWAHETAVPEVGGLLLRMPFENQVQATPGPIRDAIMRQAKMDMLRSMSGNVTPEAIQEEFESWTKNVDYMYRLAERALQAELQGIVEAAGTGQGLADAQTNLLQVYQDYARSWQEVLLLVDHGPTGSKAVVLNRPLSSRMTPALAQTFLSGKKGFENIPADDAKAFVKAFQDGIVYHGGPYDLEEPGLLIHGLDLEGSREISSSTRIFIGGHGAAARALRESRAALLDFRMFMGCRKWGPGELRAEIARGMWQCASAARPIALKQCLALPKPLWHEIMELMGGTFADLSRLERTRRESKGD